MQGLSSLFINLLHLPCNFLNPMKNAKIDNFGDLYSIDQSTCLHRTKYPNSTYIIDHFIHPLKCTPIAKVDAKLRRSKNKFLILDPEPIKIFLLSHTKYELIEVELLTGYSQLFLTNKRRYSNLTIKVFSLDPLE